MSRRQNHTAGFTLIELLIVIAIVAVLSGLLLGGIFSLRRTASRTQAAETVAGLYAAIDVYRLEYNVFPPAEADKMISVHWDDFYRDTPNPNYLLNVLKPSMNMQLTPEMFQETEVSDVRTLVDPFENPYIYNVIDPESGSTGAPNTGLWWSDKGVDHWVKIYSVGDSDNWQDTEPFWDNFEVVVFRKIGS